MSYIRRLFEHELIREEGRKQPIRRKAESYPWSDLQVIIAAHRTESINCPDDAIPRVMKSLEALIYRLTRDREYPDIIEFSTKEIQRLSTK